MHSDRKKSCNVVDNQYVGVTDLPWVQTIPEKSIALCNRKTEATFIFIIANDKGYYGLFPVQECFQDVPITQAHNDNAGERERERELS